MFWIAVAAATYAIYYIIKFYQSVSRYPKGPTPLPFIGNLHQVSSEKMHLDFQRFAKEFGGVFTVFLPTPLVVLADYEALKEGLVTKGEDFADRPQSLLNNYISFCNNGGIGFSNGDVWRAQRRTSIAILRDFGMGKNLMEQQVLNSVEEYLRCLKEIKNKDNVDMRWPLQIMIANVINEILFGFRYKFNACKPMMDFVDTFIEWTRKISESKGVFIAVQFPFLRHIPVVGDYLINWVREDRKTLSDYIMKNVARASKNYKIDEEPSCFVQAYIQKMPTNELLTEIQLLSTCNDFFIAGQETTATTLRWAMLLLAANQRVQDKIREEVLSVVGTDRLPRMADKPQMPYTTAVCHEVLRKANIIAVNIVVFRKTAVDTDVKGHRIPAGTMVNSDLHQVHSVDPLFEHPEEFRPERYLNGDGKTLKKDLVDHTIPFGLGKRQCAGEGLARVELFIVIAATLQASEWNKYVRID